VIVKKSMIVSLVIASWCQWNWFLHC